MGSKTAARAAAMRAGVPVVPGTEDPLGADVPDADDRAQSAAAIGYPLLVKAVAGGGGKGMRTVTDAGGSGRRACARRGRRPARRSATPPSTSSGG